MYVVGLAGGVLQIPGFDALFATLWGSAGTLFSAASVSAFTLAPELGWPTHLLEPIALIFGLVMLAKLLTKVVDRFTDRL